MQGSIMSAILNKLQAGLFAGLYNIIYIYNNKHICKANYRASIN